MAEKRPVGRPRRGVTAAPESTNKRQVPTQLQIDELCQKMLDEGESVPDEGVEEFRQWLKVSAEKELWFLSRWILQNDWLGLGAFHRKDVCPWLTNLKESRSKLLMLPMGHLKSTIVSRSMPLHILIQPLRGNLYFPGRLGANARIALVNETETKSKENLSYIREHLENNEWLWWCWPEMVWDNPKSDARRWSDQFIDVRHPEVKAEASITAIGVNTGFIGRYFDVILPDDIAANAASQSADVLTRAKNFRRAMRTRRVNKTDGPEGSIIIGVGTEWPAVDLYAEWQKEPTVEYMVKSIIEIDEETKEEKPLWPEKYPMDLIEKMRAENDAVDWAAWFMNRRVGRGVTALQWDQIREYSLSSDGKFILFPEIPELDSVISARKERIRQNLGFKVGVSVYNPMNAKPRRRPLEGMDNDYFRFMRLKYGRCLVCGVVKGDGMEEFPCGHPQNEFNDTNLNKFAH